MKRIVLCGSSKVKDKVFYYAEYLQKKGYDVIIPREFIVEMNKTESTKLHFNEISNKNTDCILVVNETKNGIENYIGPNTFAEIAIAMFCDKKIYLLNEIYEPCRDELIGWNAITLKGKIDNIDLK